jgi:replicative DNA helicase
MITARNPSSNEDALLGLCLQYETCIHEVLSYGLRPEHFESRESRAFFTGMLEDARSGFAPDATALLDKHVSHVGPHGVWQSHLDLVNGIARLSGSQARRVNIPRYIDQIFEASRRKSVVATARSVLAMHDEGMPTTDILSTAQRGAIEASRATMQSQELPTIEQIAQDACDRAVSVASGEARDNVVPLGLRDLDAKFSARQGDYILIGARPSMGKTHFLLSIMEQIARSAGPIQFHSIEMRSQALGDRLFAHDSSGQWKDDEGLARAGSRSVMSRWSGLPIRVDTRSRSLAQIASSLRVAKQRHGIVAASIDYLQLMRLERQGNREQEVANASRELASLASELEIVLFVLCQLNRQLENRPLHDRRPRMSDLRESGQLEQDADGILFLFRESAYNPAADRPDILEVGIAKQRNGRAPRTAFCRYVPGDGYVGNLAAGDEMRASSQQKRKL